MNAAFETLFGLLKESTPTNRTELVQALYAIRAHRSLEGIIPVARHFTDLCRDFPMLNDFPELPSYSRRLALIKRIGALDYLNPHLLGAAIKDKDINLPLTPLTGDSCIADILLIDPTGGQHHQINYEIAVAWFVWQAQRFHQSATTEPAYANYLLEENSPRLSARRLGSQIYNGFRSLRALADMGNHARLVSLIESGLPMSEKASIEFIVFYQIKSLRRGPLRDGFIRYALSNLGYDESTVVDRISQTRSYLPSGLLYMMRARWLPSVREDSPSGERKKNYRRRNMHRPSVKRSRYLTEVTGYVGDEDSVHGGTVIDLYITPESREPTKTQGTDEDDDLDDRDPVEPDISLFLGDQNELLRSYYAAKGIQSAVEYANAMLVWSHSTLSKSALAAVTDLVTFDADEDPIIRRARLAIGLSLISGRLLSIAAEVVIEKSSPWLDGRHPMGIDAEKQVLIVRAGRPQLRSPAKLTHFCHPRSEELQLPLPAAWVGLVHSLLEEKAPRGATILKRANKILDDCDVNLKISKRGISYALAREIAAKTRGDLGVLKVLTDSSSVNLDNVIHYASYPRDVIEKTWHDAVKALLVAVPTLDSPTTITRVGAIHCFDVEKLRDYFGDIQHRQAAAQAGEEWIKAYNLFTLYLSLWLGLATASRKTLSPVPRLILADNWALVTDKSRGDGSTDRVVPLTDSLMKQLDAYFAYVFALSLIYPALEPIQKTSQGYSLRLQYLRAGGSLTAYRPRYQEVHENLTELPANWARKLVYAESTILRGRQISAGVGHWTRGRHPWRQTSTFNARQFKTQWLKQQSQLETRLGFNVITAGRIETTQREVPRIPGVKGQRKSQHKTPHSPDKSFSTEQLTAILQQTDRALYDIVYDRETAGAPEALELARRALKTREDTPRDARVKLAQALCDKIRKDTKIPLFAVRPRPLLAQDWVLDGAGLQALSFVQAHVLPQFEADLAWLPPVSEAEKQADIELGRLIMIAVWRLGLTRWTSVDALIKAIARSQPILATASIHTIPIRVPHERTNEPMRRTVILDNFSSAYLTIERERLEPMLAKLFEQTARRRRAIAERALSCYLSSIKASHSQLKIAPMCVAATQRLMLNSAPIVAAYAAAKLYTEDVDDGQLRRLAGLNPIRAGLSDTDVGRVVDGEERALEDEAMPRDLQRHDRHELTRLIVHSSPHKAEWLRLIRKYKPKERTAKLLRGYALWLLNALIAEDNGSRFSKREKGHLVNRIKIVGHAIYGFSQATPAWAKIDEDTLESLAELSADHFPAKAHHGAWYRFHAFLRDESGDHGGFKIGRLGHNSEHVISARILSTSESIAIEERLGSARSGIGNPLSRSAAQRHFAIIATYGARRAEAEKLRPCDVQGDIIRIQPYGDHGLKTAWAERALPIEYADKSVRAWILQAQQSARECIIDPDVNTRAVGNNFFDGVNRVIKEVTGDQALGAHHLRHTVASRIFLSFLADSVELENVFADLSWVKSFLVEKSRLAVLVGNEGDGGQGMQAVSAVLGHSHPTTTARHYVHVMCIALFSALRSLDTLDLQRSFERRIASRATVQRWAKSAREQEGVTPDESATKRFMIGRRIRDAVVTFVGQGVHVDSTPIVRDTVDSRDIAESAENSQSVISFDELEAFDRAIREHVMPDNEEGVADAQSGFSLLAAVRSGKRGSAARRHPLEEVEPGVYLPARIAAGTATKAAVELCLWLTKLRLERSDDFEWLIKKWIYESESERGRMRLADEHESERAAGLANNARVSVVVDAAPMSKKRQSKKAQGARRMRIRCINAKSKPITRDTGAVRWVMSHVAAQWISPET